VKFRPSFTQNKAGLPTLSAENPVIWNPPSLHKRFQSEQNLLLCEQIRLLSVRQFYRPHKNGAEQACPRPARRWLHGSIASHLEADPTRSTSDRTGRPRRFVTARIIKFTSGISATGQVVDTSDERAAYVTERLVSMGDVFATT
jgi:hypothetical protein